MASRALLIHAYLLGSFSKPTADHPYHLDKGSTPHPPGYSIQLSFSDFKFIIIDNNYMIAYKLKGK